MMNELAFVVTVAVESLKNALIFMTGGKNLFSWGFGGGIIIPDS